MEIIVELILQVLGWVFQFLGELLLQILFEAVAELLGHSLIEPFRRKEPMNAWLAGIGYALYGCIAGGLSLLIIPNLFISASWLRVTNLVLTPILAGLIMSYLGARRRKREKQTIRLETFSYGFVFALAMAIIRFISGK